MDSKDVFPWKRLFLISSAVIMLEGFQDEITVISSLPGSIHFLDFLKS